MGCSPHLSGGASQWGITKVRPPKPRGEGRRDWNKNEHDKDNNSRPGESRERKAESRKWGVVVANGETTGVRDYGTKGRRSEGRGEVGGRKAAR